MYNKLFEARTSPKGKFGGFFRNVVATASAVALSASAVVVGTSVANAQVVDGGQQSTQVAQVGADVSQPVPDHGVVKIAAGAPNSTVMGNLTVTGATKSGYTTAYPCTSERPFSSVNNYVANQTVPNFAAVRTDENGDICVYLTSSAHIIWDQTVETQSLNAENARRLLDTREFGILAPIPDNGIVKVAAGAPNSTVMGNLTVTGATKSGYTTAYPCTSQRPFSSVNNYVANQTVPNFAAVRTDENGDICFYTTASTHLIWDQTVETQNVTAENARRLLDTRELFQAPPADPELVPAGTVVRFRAGIPNSTVMGNLTITSPAANGYTTAYDCSALRPLSSVNNYVANQTVPNFAAVRTDENGDMCIYTTAPAHIVWDQVVETQMVNAKNARRLTDTRKPMGILSAVPVDTYVNGAPLDVNLGLDEVANVTLLNSAHGQDLGIDVKTLNAQGYNSHIVEVVDAHGEPVDDLVMETGKQWFAPARTGVLYFTVPDSVALPLSLKVEPGARNTTNNFNVIASTPKQFSAEANGDFIKVAAERAGQNLAIIPIGVNGGDTVTTNISLLDGAWSATNLIARDANGEDLAGSMFFYKDSLEYTFNVPLSAALPVQILVAPTNLVEYELQVLTNP